MRKKHIKISDLSKEDIKRMSEKIMKANLDIKAIIKQEKGKTIDKVHGRILSTFFGVMSEATIKKEHLESLMANLKKAEGISDFDDALEIERKYEMIVMTYRARNLRPQAVFTRRILQMIPLQFIQELVDDIKNTKLLRYEHKS